MIQGSVYDRFCNHWISLIGVRLGKHLQYLIVVITFIKKQLFTHDVFSSGIVLSYDNVCHPVDVRLG